MKFRSWSTPPSPAMSLHIDHTDSVIEEDPERRHMSLNHGHMGPGCVIEAPISQVMQRLSMNHMIKRSHISEASRQLSHVSHAIRPSCIPWFISGFR